MNIYHYKNEFYELIEKFENKTSIQEIINEIQDFYDKYKYNYFLTDENKLINFIVELVNYCNWLPLTIFNKMIDEYLEIFKNKDLNDFEKFKPFFSNLISKFLNLPNFLSVEINRNKFPKLTFKELAIFEEKMDFLIYITALLKKMNFITLCETLILNHNIIKYYNTLEKFDKKNILQQLFLKKFNEILKIVDIPNLRKKFVKQYISESSGNIMLYEIIVELEPYDQKDLFKDLFKDQICTTNLNLFEFIIFYLQKLSNKSNFKIIRYILKHQKFYDTLKNYKICFFDEDQDYSNYEYIKIILRSLKNKIINTSSNSYQFKMNKIFFNELFSYMVYKLFYTDDILNIEDTLEIMKYIKTDHNLEFQKSFLCFLFVDKIKSLHDLLHLFLYFQIFIIVYNNKIKDKIMYNFVLCALKKSVKLNFKNCTIEDINIINGFFKECNYFFNENKRELNYNNMFTKELNYEELLIENFKNLIILYKNIPDNLLRLSDNDLLLNLLYNTLEALVNIFSIIKINNIYIDHKDLIETFFKFIYFVKIDHWDYDNDSFLIRFPDNEKNLVITIDNYLENLLNLVIIKNLFPQYVINLFLTLHLFENSISLEYDNIKGKFNSTLIMTLLNLKIVKILKNFENVDKINNIRNGIRRILDILKSLFFKNKKDFVNHFEYDLNFSLDLFKIETMLFQIFEFLIKKVISIFFAVNNPDIKEWENIFKNFTIGALLSLIYGQNKFKKIHDDTIKKIIQEIIEKDIIINTSYYNYNKNSDFNFLFFESEFMLFNKIRILRNDFFHINKYIIKEEVIDEINLIIKGIEQLFNILIRLFVLYHKKALHSYPKNDKLKFEIKIIIDNNSKYYSLCILKHNIFDPYKKIDLNENPINGPLIEIKNWINDLLKNQSTNNM